MPLRIPVIDLERTGGGMWLRPFYQMVLTGTLAFSDEDPRFDVGIGFFF